MIDKIMQRRAAGLATYKQVRRTHVDPLGWNRSGGGGGGGGGG